MSAPQLVTIGLAALLASIALVSWLLSRSTYTRRGGLISQWRQLRSARSTQIEPPAAAEMTRFQIVHDRLVKWRMRRSLRQAATMKALLAGAIAKYDLLFTMAPALARNHRRALESFGDEHVHLGRRLGVRCLNAMLLAGDIAIVSSALQRHDLTLTPLAAIVSSSAIAVTLWLSGKLLGANLAKIWSGREQAALSKLLAGASLAVIVLGAIGLGAIRQEDFWTWVALSSLPGFGSAAVTLLSSSQKYQRLWATERTWEACRRRLWWQIGRIAKVEAKLGRHTAEAEARVSAMQQLELSVAASAGTIRPEPDLYARGRNRLLDRLLGPPQPKTISSNGDHPTVEGKPGSNEGTPPPSAGTNGSGVMDGYSSGSAAYDRSHRLLHESGDAGQVDDGGGTR